MYAHIHMYNFNGLRPHAAGPSRTDSGQQTVDNRLQARVYRPRVQGSLSINIAGLGYCSLQFNTRCLLVVCCSSFSFFCLLVCLFVCCPRHVAC